MIKKDIVDYIGDRYKNGIIIATETKILYVGKNMKDLFKEIVLEEISNYNLDEFNILYITAFNNNINYEETIKKYISDCYIIDLSKFTTEEEILEIKELE